MAAVLSDTVVTSFSPAGARLYGERMVASLRRYWPKTTTLVVYLDAPATMPGVTTRLTSDLGAWVACRRRWADDPLTHGLSTPEVPRSKAYDYRWDCYRFAVKVFVWLDAAHRAGTGIVTWLDGDTVTRAPVSAGWTAALLREADVAYLGRVAKHPETGYVGFRVPEALPLLEWCADAYGSDRFRSLPGWTDCHILQAGIAAVAGVRAKNLTAGAEVRRAHIWPYSPLARYLTHDKSRSRRQQDQKRLVTSTGPREAGCSP